MATNSAYILIFNTVALLIFSACAQKPPIQESLERSDKSAFSEHLRSNGYDWYNTNTEGNTLHFNTSDARAEDGLIFAKMSIYYKNRKTNPCGPLGDTTPRQYDDFYISLNPETNVASIYTMDGYDGYKKTCHEHPKDPIRTTYNSKSVFALWLDHWMKTTQGGSLLNTNHSNSSSGVGIESLIKWR